MESRARCRFWSLLWSWKAHGCRSSQKQHQRLHLEEALRGEEPRQEADKLTWNFEKNSYVLLLLSDFDCLLLFYSTRLQHFTSCFTEGWSSSVEGPKQRSCSFALICFHIIHEKIIFFFLTLASFTNETSSFFPPRVDLKLKMQTTNKNTVLWYFFVSRL